MRVLCAPELYAGHERIENNIPVMDLAQQVKYWLELDENLHVYWMLPGEQHLDYYNESFVHGDHDRVTIFNERRFGQGSTSRKVDSWREEQLEDLRDTIRKAKGWFDVVITQHCESQDLLWRYLHDAYRHDYTSVEPFSLVYNVWQFNSEHKGHSRYRNHSPVLMDLTAASVADEVWAKHEWDMDDMLNHARTYLSYDMVKDIDDKTRYMSMPVDFESYECEWGKEPQTLHLNDTLNMDSAHIEPIIDMGERLYAMYDIEMVITSQDDNVDDDLKKEFVTFHENPQFEQYKKILRRSDIGISATLDETPGIRPIEQLASGQVLVPVRRPWVDEFIGSDYKFVSSNLEQAFKYLSWSVSNWAQAKKHARSGLSQAKRTCSAKEIAKESLQRMRDLNEQRTAEYSFTWDEDVLRATLNRLGGDGPHDLATINRKSEKETDSGNRILNIFGYTLADMIAALRKLGYKDTGAKKPAFVKE